MNLTIENNQVKDTFRQVSTYSLVKKRTQDELVVNHFLDSILKLQYEINSDCLFLEGLVEQFEKISWLESAVVTKNSDDTLNLINAIIAVTNDVHRLIFERYTFINKNAKKYASVEIKRLKIALDDVKEASTDLENVFIILPKDNDFQEANKQLQSL